MIDSDILDAIAKVIASHDNTLFEHAGVEDVEHREHRRFYREVRDLLAQRERKGWKRIFG